MAYLPKLNPRIGGGLGGLPTGGATTARITEEFAFYSQCNANESGQYPIALRAVDAETILVLVSTTLYLFSVNAEELTITSTLDSQTIDLVTSNSSGFISKVNSSGKFFIVYEYDNARIFGQVLQLTGTTLSLVGSTVSLVVSETDIDAVLDMDDAGLMAFAINGTLYAVKFNGDATISLVGSDVSLSAAAVVMPKLARLSTDEVALCGTSIGGSNVLGVFTVTESAVDLVDSVDINAATNDINNATFSIVTRGDSIIEVTFLDINRGSDAYRAATYSWNGSVLTEVENVVAHTTNTDAYHTIYSPYSNYRYLANPAKVRYVTPWAQVQGSNQYTVALGNSSSETTHMYESLLSPQNSPSSVNCLIPGTDNQFYCLAPVQSIATGGAAGYALNKITIKGEASS